MTVKQAITLAMPIHFTINSIFSVLKFELWQGPIPKSAINLSTKKSIKSMVLLKPTSLMRVEQGDFENWNITT